MHKYKALNVLAILALMAGTVFTGAAPAQATQPMHERADAKQAPDATVNITLLHTNDFHGNLELSGSNPGIARVAYAIKNVQAAVGVTNTLLMDAGDIMQGSLLSNLKKGEPTIDLYNYLGYGVSAVGNHEFDWGQTTLISRTTQAQFPFVAANLVVSDTGSCATAGWTVPSFVRPWITKTVGAPGNEAVLGIIGTASIETPYITIASATQGLCFKDPAASIIHYYDDMRAAGADAIVVLSHNGYTDGGYGYGFTVNGDQTLARQLVAAGKKADLIIGGHSHTNLLVPTVISGTTVVQAYYAGRKVGRADLAIDTATNAVNVTWQPITVSTTLTEDVGTKAQLTTWSSDPDYQAQINQVIGYTNVDMVRDYNGDNMMGTFVNDAVYNDLNTDGNLTNDVDLVFNNAGGLRADITSTTKPLTLTYGLLFSVLPFGNATAVGDMTGAQILDILNQSATLFKGAIQPSGIKFKFFVYTDTLPGPQPWAWGAYDITVKNRTSGLYEPLVMTQTYRVATNEFLAPAGQDGYSGFKYMTNITYWGDMLDSVDRWVSSTYTIGTPYNGPNGDGLLDGRITRVGAANGLYNPSDPTQVVPVTVLHHNDPHGNLLKGAFVGYTQLATLIAQERAHNPTRNLLLQGGDAIQGDAMMYYYKSAALGYAADGTPLSSPLNVNPMVAALNAMTYTAMTLGNHEYNFGKDVFTSTLQQANFPVLQANVYDDGQYGLASVPVKSDITVSVPGPSGNIDIAVLGIGNHRVPNYELPSNIPGLSFTNPITETQARAPVLAAANDAVIALTHIGFTTNPKSVEVDANVDTNLAAQTTGVDVIIGSHSHTNPAAPEAPYKYLPAIVGAPDNTPVLINQAYRYNNTLGEVVMGFLPDGFGGYNVVSRAGRYISVATSTPEDARIKSIITPYLTPLTTYTLTQLAKTDTPIDTLAAFTQETNGANLQADASVAELQSHSITVDFHLSGAMTNKLVASAASPANPIMLTVNDMFAGMPYENSLVVLQMNGPQLKTVLERAYRNYYYYKYVPGYGGYSYYTTCMLDTNAGNNIVYRDTYPDVYTNTVDHVQALIINGVAVDFTNATKYYNVSTVNYLAAGSCNFNDAGVSLWPLNQIVADTQYYVRDAVIHYLTGQTLISPKIEGRVQFPKFTNVMPGASASLVYTDTHGMATTFNFPADVVAQAISVTVAPILPSDIPPNFLFAGHGFDLNAYLNGVLQPGFRFYAPGVGVTIHYTDADVAGMVEENLRLYYWGTASPTFADEPALPEGTAPQWIDAGCGINPYTRDLDNNILTVQICHLSRFGAFAPSLLYLYLPLIAR